MIRIIATGILLLLSTILSAQDTVTVFQNGDDGYACYRIPAIVKTSNGELLAFCEARKTNCADHGDVRIVLKRSTDNGKTWGKLEQVAENGGFQTGNSAPVFDLMDKKYKNGRLFLFYNTGSNASEYEVREGKAVREAWYKTSVDNGKTWSNPTNITASVSKPNNPKFNPAYTFSEDWRAIANTPGHALQISSGKHKGRIFVAANHSSGQPKNDFSDYAAHGYYSDDHGKSWQLTPTIAYPSSNESTAAELSNGGLIMNIREQAGLHKKRILAFSSNAGEKWDTAYIENQLPDPVCQGSMINYTANDGRKSILFSNLNSELNRENLSIYQSFNDGLTWEIIAVICKGSAAYSDLVIQQDNQIGILYEKDDYSKIVYQVVPNH